MPSRRAAFRGRVRAAPNSAGRFLETWGGFGAGDGQFDTPTGIAVNATGTVYVADSFSARIQRFNSTGTFLGKWGSFGAGDGQFNNPIAIAIDSTGDAWVADSNEGRIQEFSATGAVLLAIIGDDVLSGALFTPRGLAVDAADNVYVTDLGKDRVLLYDEYGAYISQWGDEFGGSARGQLPNPEGITVDGTGDVLVVANALTEVKRFDPTMRNSKVNGRRSGSGTPQRASSGRSSRGISLRTSQPDGSASSRRSEERLSSLSRPPAPTRSWSTPRSASASVPTPRTLRWMW